MNFKKLCSDPESLKTFTILNADLLKAGSFFAGGVDPDSISDMSDDALREAQNAYESLASAVYAMQRIFEAPSKVTTDSTEKTRSIDRQAEYESANRLLIELVKKKEEKAREKAEEDRRERQNRPAPFAGCFGPFDHL